MADYIAPGKTSANPPRSRSDYTAPKPPAKAKAPAPAEPVAKPVEPAKVALPTSTPPLEENAPYKIAKKPKPPKVPTGDN